MNHIAWNKNLKKKESKGEIDQPKSIHVLLCQLRPWLSYAFSSSEVFGIAIYRTRLNHLQMDLHHYPWQQKLSHVAMKQYNRKK